MRLTLLDKLSRQTYDNGRNEGVNLSQFHPQEKGASRTGGRQGTGSGSKKNVVQGKGYLEQGVIASSMVKKGTLWDHPKVITVS